MNLRNESRTFKAAHYLWLVGMTVFIAGGVFLDSWAVMGVGGLLIVAGILVMGALL